MRVDATILRRIDFYRKGNQRLCALEKVHSLPEAINILKRTLTGEMEGLEVRTDGALLGIPVEINGDPLESINAYLAKKMTVTPHSFVRGKHETYFNPFRRGHKTHYIEIVHGIKSPEPRYGKKPEEETPYEGLFIQFKTIE